VENKFEYLGVFYTNNNYKFREVLNIRRKSISQESPDLIVIMMNPGSSEPINGNDNSIVETYTKPDNTQSQVVAVMENLNYNYARVLNLSDVREAKSKNFYDLIKKLDEEKINHSIFSDARKNDLDKLFEPDIPVIIAWGVDKVLEKLAMSALTKLQDYPVAGIKKELTDFAFYHPYQRLKKSRIRWIDCITKQLKHMRELKEFKENVLAKFTEHITDSVFLMIQNDRKLMSEYLRLVDNGSLKNINSEIAKEIKKRYNLANQNNINYKPKSFLINSYELFESK